MELAFVELGWGVATGLRHDVGTDLIVMARDNRLFDLGLMIGIQVKSGSSWFSEAVQDASGAATGWWFRDDDRKHVDYWLKHAVPHLIVLYHPDSKMSYWAHVTTESVVSTGKGAKVFVPRANTIDVEHRNALLEVAATRRVPSAWEGSVWTGADNILPADRLRYALVVPRLITPHRNAGIGAAASAEVVVGLLVEGRLTDIDRMASQYATVPTLDEAANSPDWVWRFVGALGTRVTTGAVDSLLPLIGEAPSSPARAAVTVVTAATLLEQAQPDRALDLLQSALDRDDNSPVDHAWLAVQHARAYLEVGRVDEARASAVQVQEVRRGHADDVTATAIAGTAALLLFAASDIGSRDVQEAIMGLDTTAVWWRSQRVATGSNAVIEREFTQWSRRTGFRTFAAEDVANNRLFTASLLANHLGDHNTWCHLDSLNTQQALLRIDRESEPDRVRDLLTALRRNGDDKALEHAVRRLVADGPAIAVAAAAAEIDFAHWTHTTSRTNLTLLRRSGDVLDEHTAAVAVGWLLATLKDPNAFVARTRPKFTLGSRLVDTLAGVVPAAPSGDQLIAAEFVLALPAQHDQLMAISWARVIRALPASTWAADLAYRATESATVHHAELRLALLGAAAPICEKAREALLVEIRDSSWNALAEFGDLTHLPEDAAQHMINMAEARINNTIADATQGADVYGSHDAGQALVVLNRTHLRIARWDPIYALLGHRQVAAHHKRDICSDLARAADRLDPDVRARLNEIAMAIVGQPSAPLDRYDDRPSAIGPAAALAASTSTNLEATQHLLTQLLSGNDDQCVWATWVAMRLDPSVAAGVLATLARDEDTSVRAAAASCLAGLVINGSADPLAIAALNQSLDDPGTRVPLHIAKSLADHPEPNAVACSLLNQLGTHRSAAVRAAAADHYCPQ